MTECKAGEHQRRARAKAHQQCPTNASIAFVATSTAAANDDCGTSGFRLTRQLLPYLRPDSGSLCRKNTPLRRCRSRAITGHLLLTNYGGYEPRWPTCYQRVQAFAQNRLCIAVEMHLDSHGHRTSKMSAAHDRHHARTNEVTIVTTPKCHVPVKPTPATPSRTRS